MSILRILVVFAIITATAAGVCRAQDAAANDQAGTPAAKPYRGRLLAMTGDEDSPVHVWNAAGEPVFEPYYVFARKGLALVDPDYTLRIQGGHFFSPGADDHFGAAMKNARGELTIAAYIDPDVVNSDCAGCIIAYGPAEGKPLFALVQEKNELTFVIGGDRPGRTTLWTLKTDQPFHLLVTVGKADVVVYIDGQKKESLAGVNADFAKWPAGLLYFGNNAEMSQPWRGKIQRAAVYNVALGPEQAAQAAAAVIDDIKDRQPPDTIELVGTLLARSQYPSPWKEGFTYREVLAVCEYKVDKVIRGKYEGKTIRVAEWMYVDRIFVTNSSRKIGAARRLKVNRLDVNPQLRTIERGDTLPLDMDATIHYDLSSLEALPDNEQPKPPDNKRSTKGE